MFFRKLAAFIRKGFLIQVSYKLSFILSCLGIIFPVVIFYFVAKLFGADGISPYLKEYNGEYFSFVLIGLAFYGYLSVSLTAFSMSLTEEQMTGTLEAIFLTPTKASTLIISMPCWDFIFGSLNAFICLSIGICFLGAKLVNFSFLAVIIIIILTIIYSVSIGIASAAFIMIFKRGNPVIWLINLFSVFFGGVCFPVTILPSKLRLVSYFLPITYSLTALRKALLNGYNLKFLLPEMLILSIFCIVLFPLSIAIFKYSVKKAKVDGSLAHY